MWKTGHSLIKSKMKETGAPLAGEMSGHIFFKHRYYGFDDGIYSAARLLELVARDGRKLSAMLDGVPKTWASPEIRFDFPEEKKFRARFAMMERKRDYDALNDAMDKIAASSGATLPAKPAVTIAMTST